MQRTSRVFGIMAAWFFLGTLVLLGTNLLTGTICYGLLRAGAADVPAVAAALAVGIPLEILAFNLSRDLFVAGLRRWLQR